MVPETPEAEFVSLEEADAEAPGARRNRRRRRPKRRGGGTARRERSTMRPSSRRSEEEDTDVTEIIGGDIENEEERVTGDVICGWSDIFGPRCGWDDMVTRFLTRSADMGP